MYVAKRLWNISTNFQYQSNNICVINVLIMLMYEMLLMCLYMYILVCTYRYNGLALNYSQLISYAALRKICLWIRFGKRLLLLIPNYHKAWEVGVHRKVLLFFFFFWKFIYNEWTYLVPIKIYDVEIKA